MHFGRRAATEPLHTAGAAHREALRRRVIHEAREIRPVGATDAVKLTAHENFSVTLDAGGFDEVVRIGIESHIEAPVCVESRNVISSDGVDGCEIAADNGLSIGLQSDA